MTALTLASLTAPWLQGGGYRLFSDPVWFVLALVLIVVVGAALLAQARQTPKNRARYHLEGHAPGDDTAHEPHESSLSAAHAAPPAVMHHDPAGAAWVHNAPAMLIDEELATADTDDLAAPPQSPYPPEEPPSLPAAERPLSMESTAPPATVPDDLKLIEGIGPKIAALLAEHGVTTFAALADSSPVELDRILDEAGLQMHDAQSWPDQAQLAANGEWDQLHELQSRLKGGRQSGPTA